jgi:hypothetical protein
MALISPPILLSHAGSTIQNQIVRRANNITAGSSKEAFERSLVAAAIDKAHLPVDLPLRCRCGRVRGVAREVAPHTGFRFVCYCTDCQAFARFLERPDVLDAAGGTDIVHLPAARVALTAGADAVRCITFSSKVLRWYADCCRTPIANTAATPRFPIVALIHSFIDHGAHGRSRDDMLGPPLRRTSTNAPPSLRSLRTLRRHRRSACSCDAQQDFSAGGGVGLAGQIPFSTIVRMHRCARRVCSSEASSPPSRPFGYDDYYQLNRDSRANSIRKGAAISVVCFQSRERRD